MWSRVVSSVPLLQAAWVVDISWDHREGDRHSMWLPEATGLDGVG